MLSFGSRLCSVFFAFALIFCVSSTLSAQVWLEWDDVTSTNMLAESPAIGGPNDVEEKDFDVGDFDQDGDIDLVVVRKTPVTTWGPRPNVLFMNVGTVLTDMTEDYAAELSIADNARDVRAVDLDGDTWLDLVIVISGTTTIDGDQPRVFMNLGDDPSGDWLGFEEDTVRIPILLSPSGRNPNFCAVAAGDIDGDGDPDLYMTDYRNDLEDVLLINDGLGFFEDETTDRLPAGFEQSGFGTSCEIVDLNADGFLDIIKVSAGSISAAYNDGTGNFAVSQGLAASAPYGFTTGDLNDDGKRDVYIVQDGQDQYQLNNSDPGTIPVSWSSQPVSPSPLTGGFGGTVHIVDMDFDDDQDVVVTDVDIDVSGCNRRLAFLRNNGGAVVDVSDPYPSGGPWTPAHHQGSYDTAIADFNGDGAMDIWVGHCNGNDLYFQVPAVPPLLGVQNLACMQQILDVGLSWTNPTVYDSIEIRRDGNIVASVGGGESSYLDVAVPSGNHSYTLRGMFGPATSPPTSCVILVSTVNPVTDTTCVQFDSDVVLTWTNNGSVAGADYDSVTIGRNGVELATLGGSLTTYTDVEPPLGLATYTLQPMVGSDSGALTVCSMNVAPTNATDLVLDFSDDDGGDTDSAAAIDEALAANARVVNRVFLDSITELPSLNIDMNDFERVWVELGTFPDNHVLASGEGAMLADFVEDGIGGGDLFLSGGDTFCFDNQTAVHALTGVSPACSDGSGSVANVEGQSLSECSFFAFGDIDFDGEDDNVDRLSPLTTAQPVLVANTQGTPFNAATLNFVGNHTVIAQSVELGGVGEEHDKVDLVDLYLHCLPSGFPPPVAAFSGTPTVGEAPLTVQFTSEAVGTGINGHAWFFDDGGVSTLENPVHTFTGLGTYTITYTVTAAGGQDTHFEKDYIQVIPPGGAEFRRGDVDGDGVFNGLTDALSALSFQFIPGSAIPPCLSAADANDDGVFNGLTDGLFLLSYQFVPGSAEPPFPGPSICGPDPTPDGISCDAACP